MEKTVDDIVAVQGLAQYAEDAVEAGRLEDARWAARRGRDILEELDVIRIGGDWWGTMYRERFDRIGDVALAPYGRWN